MQLCTDVAEDLAQVAQPSETRCARVHACLGSHDADTPTFGSKVAFADAMWPDLRLQQVFDAPTASRCVPRRALQRVKPGMRAT